MQLEIVASDTSWINSEYVGHAFMTISLPLSTGLKEDSYGFYPLNGGVGVVCGPGILQSEPQKNPSRFSRISVSIKRPITEVQRQAILATATDWNSHHYNLLNESCIDFIVAVAKSAGWNIPPRSVTDLPKSYVTKLRDANAIFNCNGSGNSGTVQFGSLHFCKYSIQMKSVVFSFTINQQMHTVCGGRLGDDATETISGCQASPIPTRKEGYNQKSGNINGNVVNIAFSCPANPKLTAKFTGTIVGSVVKGNIIWTGVGTGTSAPYSYSVTMPISMKTTIFVE